MLLFIQKDILCSVGGSSPGDATRRMLAKLLTNDAAAKYSFLGLKGKLKFSNLKICEVLLDKSNICFITVADLSTNKLTNNNILHWADILQVFCTNL